MLIAHLLNYATARFADERDRRGVLRLIVEQLGRELDRVVDRAGVRVERVAEAIFLAPAAAHLEQRLRELLRLRLDAREQRACAFAGRLQRRPRRAQCRDERTKVIVHALEVGTDGVLSDVHFDRQGARLESERKQQPQSGQRYYDRKGCALHGEPIYVIEYANTRQKAEPLQ